MTRYFTLPDQGWSWAVLLASFGSHCIHGFFLTAIGILQMSLLDHYKESVFKTSLALSIFLGLLSSSGPLASLIANRWSCRVSLVTGGFIVSLSLLATAFMPNIIFVFFSLGIFGGVGIGIAFTSSVVVVGYNFEKKRNFASGVAVSGIGIGAFTLAPLMQSASNYFGYRGLMLMCSGLTLQYCVFGALLYPSKLEVSRKKEIKLSNYNSSQGSKLQRLREVYFFLSKRALLCVYISMFLCNLGIYLVFLHFASYVTSVGFSKLEAAFLISVCGICNCMSRILVGSATNSNNIDEFVLYAGSFSLIGLTTVLFPLYGQTYGGQVFYMVTLGMYSGICYALLNSISVILAGINNLATVYGLILFFTGLGCFIGPLLGGFIVNSGGTYGQSITAAGILILIGAIFAWVSGVGDRQGAHPADTEETIVFHENESKIIKHSKENMENQTEKQNENVTDSNDDFRKERTKTKFSTAPMEDIKDKSSSETNSLLSKC
ncbi:monocarboxylate transporter 13-like [Saccostrea echinata]|uniref:monocarboxylate transporter 13-like n=1 Tax=Saccostrea echinata TaxID=191078 RepID=UPI002A80976D|nr:monocarboxylate transporter 13-like [Saccostrea echinata]